MCRSYSSLRKLYFYPSFFIDEHIGGAMDSQMAWKCTVWANIPASPTHGTLCEGSRYPKYVC